MSTDTPDKNAQGDKTVHTDRTPPLSKNTSSIFKDGQPVFELPTEGVYEIRQPDGHFVISYKDGKKNGEMLIYKVDNKLISKVTYQNDILYGPSANYFPEGNVEIMTVFKDNLLEGPFISYYPNGVKQCEGNYSKGKLEGPFTFYDEFGDLAKKTTYQNGLEHGTSTAYFPKSQGGGICQTSHYEKGLLVQNQELFYATGELLQKTPYKQGKAQAYPIALDKQGKEITDPANKNRGK